MDYWGGDQVGMLPPPLKLLGGGAGPPSSYAYDMTMFSSVVAVVGRPHLF